MAFRTAPWLLIPLATSVSAAADYPMQANLRYSRHAETVLDILQPRTPALKNRPVVVMIHGGTSKDEALPFCAPFLDHGMVVANIDYRTTGVESRADILDAIGFLRERASEYKIEPKRIILVGLGSGAKLAMEAGTQEASTVIAVSGPRQNSNGGAPILTISREGAAVVPDRTGKKASSRNEAILLPGGDQPVTDSEFTSVWPRISKWLAHYKLLNCP